MSISVGAQGTLNRMDIEAAPGVKGQDREAELHLVLTLRIHRDTCFPCVFMAWLLNKHRENFGARGSVVVKTIWYKPQGRGFETRPH
jgi:hypothetical protein